jgi:hypothetical protein
MEMPKIMVDQLIGIKCQMLRKKTEFSIFGIKQGVTTTNFDFKLDYKKWLNRI